jgi:hypothetical protein
MWLALTLASAAAAPPDVDLNDILRWESGAERLLDMPSGCWEWVGEAKWDWDVGRFGGSKGDAVFAGRTRDGTWGSVHLEPMGELLQGPDQPLVEVYDAKEARFAPLVGKFKGARVTVDGADPSRPGVNRTEADLEQNAAAANVLRVALDRLTSDAYTSDARWDDERHGVILHREVALAEGDKDLVDYEVFFPDGGTLPTAVDLVFPSKFHTGRFPRWTIHDATVHVRGAINGDRVFPTSEAFSFGFSIFGLHFHGAQTVRYRRVSRCPVPAPAAPTAPAPTASSAPPAP